MNRRSLPTGPFLLTLLATASGSLRAEVPGELGADDLTGIREAYLAAKWNSGLGGVELDPAATAMAFRLPAEAEAAAATSTQQAYLKASNTGAGDFFGSVAISGDTVVVGAPFESSKAEGVNGNQKDNSVSHSGAAYVFVRKGTKWKQQAYLKSDLTQVDAQFGFSVGISGDSIIVGAFGAADTSTDTSTDAATDATVVTKLVGEASVFTRTGTTWSKQQVLQADKATEGDAFGYSVAISGDTAVIGVLGDSSDPSSTTSSPTTLPQSGAAYVFKRSSKTWTKQAILKASNPDQSDLFGISVAISGDTIAVGATGEASNATGVVAGAGATIGPKQKNNQAAGAGAVYVFKRATSGTTWPQQAYLKASNTGAGDHFGRSVAIEGDLLVTGAYGESSKGKSQTDNSAKNAGAAYVFVREAAKWKQQAYLKASNPAAGDQFGFSVALSNGTVVVGAPAQDGGGTDAGAAYVFTNAATIWNQESILKATNKGAGDQFGFSVGVADDTVIAGALGEASNAMGVNGTATNNSAKNAGAAYVFSGVGQTGSAIAVEQPAGTNLKYASASVGFGNIKLSDTSTRVFKILSAGTSDLSNLAISISGTGAASFALDTTGMATSLLPAKATTFSVNFKPSGTASGSRTATLKIASNDKYKNPFEITISGSAFSTTLDTDGDGLNDWAEVQYASLGFDWQNKDTEKVAKLLAGANAAGLYTQAQLQALEVSTPLLTKDSTTGKVTLTLALEKSTDLKTYTPFPMTGAKVNSSTGNVEFGFTSTDTAQFFRVKAK